MKKHNFNAGPSILPRVAIENAAKAILDFEGIGLSLLEISHRTKDFEAVNDEAEALFRELLHIPDNYKVLFLGGGASTQFFEVPYNFLEKKAGYVNTGVWAKKAIKEAKLFGEVEVLASSEDKNFTYIPKGYAIPSDLDYLHITSNNTIYGTEYHTDIDSPVPLIADMSSDILSRPVDVSKYAMIYGGAQKNIGPAGVTFVIVRGGRAGQGFPSAALDGRLPQSHCQQVDVQYASRVRDLCREGDAQVAQVDRGRARNPKAQQGESRSALRRN